MNACRIICTTLCLGAWLSIGAAQEAPSRVDQLDFKVMLDDKEIGHHRFKIARRGTTSVVQIEAEFNVRILFVNAYTYLHRNVETWEGDCLRRIYSETNDNGRLFEVSGGQRGDSFSLLTESKFESLKRACVTSFAYWDRDFLTRSQLLNSQTGELIQVRSEKLGDRYFEHHGSMVRAEGHRIVSEEAELDISVWYGADDDRWLALESRVENGRVLRYLPIGFAAIAQTDSFENRGKNS